MKAINEINKLCKQYPLFTLESNLIGEVRHWIEDSFKSQIPESFLGLAESYIDVYDIQMEKKSELSCKLREIIQNAHNELLIKNQTNRT